MSVSSDGKKISGPIFWGDPYTVLRVSPSTSAGYDAGTIICHVNINKWSKRKPMRYDQFEPLTELQFAGTVQGLTWCARPIGTVTTKERNQIP